MGTDDLITNLEQARSQLAQLAAGATPAGLTEPDPDTPEERWDAAQVWAHIAEFVAYWQHELERVVRDYDGAPVPFGRVKTDAGRIRAIEVGRHRSIADLAAQADREMVAAGKYLSSLPAAAWDSRGLHQIRGVMSVEQMVERFVINHLDEHANQLEGLQT